MEEFLKGAMLGMVAGVCVGAVIVAKNKKLANKLKNGLTTAEEKLKEAKEDLQEKLESKECDCDDYDCRNGEFNSKNCSNLESKDFSKKTKNP